MPRFISAEPDSNPSFYKCGDLLMPLSLSVEPKRARKCSACSDILIIINYCYVVVYCTKP